MNKRILIASDLHLSEVIWTTRPEISGDSYFALKEIYRQAVAHDVGRVFLLGDVFDTYQPTARDVVHYQEFSHDLKKHNIQLYYIEGQHDRSSFRKNEKNHIAWCDTTECATHVDRQVVAINDEINAYCMDWRHTDDIVFELERIPENCTWLFAHQAWTELMSPSCRSDHQLLKIPEHIDVVFTGDKHHHNVVTLGERRLYVYSPGCTHMRKKNEPTSFAVFLVDDGRVRSLPIRSRPIRKFYCPVPGMEADIEEFLKTQQDSTLPEEVAKPLCIVQHCKELTNYVRVLRDRKVAHIISETVAFRDTSSEKGDNKSEASASVVLTDVRLDNTDDMVKSLLAARTSHNEKIHRTAHMLLDHPQPKRLLEQMIDDLEKEINSCDSSDSSSKTSAAMSP